MTRVLSLSLSGWLCGHGAKGKGLALIGITKRLKRVDVERGTAFLFGVTFGARCWDKAGICGKVVWHV
ncbi:hypothetical protein GRI99_10255 [Altererythrobacter buctensis]|uniref:Uncharacterized protein n=2 Tax=Alteraurantiacibacter buctensis TaxID=1503981 RepID=A0A844Z0U5_9SPHN|nr:hypothetical protein [Alteraurantiacibacter buctensis]